MTTTPTAEGTRAARTGPVARPQRRATAAACGALALVVTIGLAPGAAAQQPPAPATTASKPDPLAAALAPRPRGLTPTAAAQAASSRSPSVAARRAELLAAAARVDQAFVAYFPRLTVTATYTRYSSQENVIAVGSCPDNPVETCQLPADQLEGPALYTYKVPLFLNTYAVVASLSVPISDYALRLSQSYSSASHAAQARNLEMEAEALVAAADAKIAFYNWVSARGQLVVARLATVQAAAHVSTTKELLAVGRGSTADVLRFESLLAAAQQVEAESGALADIAETQLRVQMSAPAQQKLEIGIDVFAEPVRPKTAAVDALVARAMKKRLELRALEASQASLRAAESVARAGYFPRVDAFGNVQYANPNQRAIPSREGWLMTWDAGLRATWVINETFSSIGAVSEAEARVAAVEAQKSTLRNAIRLEVERAAADARKSAAVTDSADRGLASAEESLRVRRELFAVGRASAVDVVDAETEVTRARLAHLNARIAALVAAIRLEHAVGDDLK